MEARLVYATGVLPRTTVVVATLIACWAVPPAGAGAQTGWGEPLRPPTPAEPSPPPAEPAPTEPIPDGSPPARRTEPNPDWADAPPTQYEQRAPDNPDWVEEVEAPPVGDQRAAASESYDVRYANRGLTMPRGMMRGSFDTVVGRNLGNFDIVTGRALGDTVSTMNFGAAITLARDFEIGFSRYRMGSYPDLSLRPSLGFGGEGLVSFFMSPDAAFGDIPLYARFQGLDRRAVKLAVDAVFRIPSRTEFGFLGGIPLRFVIQERFAFDTGAQFVLDQNPNAPALYSVNWPLKFVANATDQFFVQLMSGMVFFDLSQTIRTATSGLIQGPFYFIPLGVGAGYTVATRTTMMDIFASFRFPAFYGFTSRASDLTADIWQLTVGLNIYSPILFKRSAL